LFENGVWRRMYEGAACEGWDEDVRAKYERGPAFYLNNANIFMWKWNFDEQSGRQGREDRRSWGWGWGQFWVGVKGIYFFMAKQ
jgi:hypothetical protein